MYYAIGDIHGYLTPLKILYFKIKKDILKYPNENHTIIFLGDYIDRGPESKQVLDFIMSLKNTADLEYIFLKGNHEQMLIDSFHGLSDQVLSMWLCNGAVQTLDSFGIDYDRYHIQESAVLKPYVDFLEKTKLYFETDNYIFCHSGFISLDKRSPLENQEDNILWGRPKDDRYINYDKLVIHGHTPINKPNYNFNKINVDIGCGKKHGMYNRLAAVKLPLKRENGGIEFIISH